MQKISPIHWLIEIQQILEIRYLQDRTHFLSQPSKNY